MAHNLSTFVDANGATRQCLMSLRENPWHQLGQIVEQPVGSPDAITLAGLDWRVDLHGMYTDQMNPIERYRAAVRSDTKATLGVVKDQFHPVQNAELFAWFDSLSSQGIVYETAGALGAGETCWILARMPEEIRIGNDLTRTYMLVFNGHGGNRLLTVAPTGIRVVCQNTLRLAAAGIRSQRGKRQLEAGFRIRHTNGVHAALADVAAAYTKTRASIVATRDAYQHLARTPMTEAMITAVLERSFRRDTVAVSEADRAAAMRRAREERIRCILASPTCTGDGVNGTALALLHSLSEYVDHFRQTRTKEGQATCTQRFASAHWGSGASIKEAAWDAIIELANA